MTFGAIFINMFKVNNRNTRTKCEICSKLLINTADQRQSRRSGVFIVNFEHISHLVLVFLLLPLNMLMKNSSKRLTELLLSDYKFQNGCTLLHYGSFN